MRYLIIFLILPFLLNAYQQETTLSINESKITKKHYLSVACIFKNDADYLKEWIEYHLIVGVEHFYLLNNESEDSYKEVLQPYIDKKIVTLIDWKTNRTENPGKPYTWVFSTQVPALEYACNNLAKNESKWVAFIDTDEFLVPILFDNVTDVLKKYDKESGIAISWRVFGTGNIKKIEKNELMIELLTKCTTAEDSLCAPEKTIAKTEKFLKFATCPPHYCDYNDGTQCIHPPKNEIVINHYMNRDESHFYQVKIKNRETMRNYKFSEAEIAQLSTLGNSMEDDNKHIFKFIPELRRKMNTK